MKTIKFSVMFICLLVAISCDESVLDKQNKNNQTTLTFYKSEAEVLSAVTSIYAGLQGNNLDGREWFFLHDLRGDEMATGGGHLEAPRNQLLTGSHSPANSVLSDVWTGLYRVIHRANSVIQYAAEPTFADEAVRNRYIGEAKFLRAWAYYNLYGFWGNVPIYEKFVTALSEAAPVSPAADVKALIIADLNAAIASLPASYSGPDLGRASKTAAQALLAKLYMFDAQYAEAKPLLEAVIATGVAAAGGTPLVDNYFDNFSEETEYNKESIWEISYNSTSGYAWNADGDGAGGTEVWLRSQEYSAVGWRNLIPSDKLLAEFENNDPRLKFNFYFTGDKYGDPAAQKTLSEGDQRGNTSVFKGVPQKVSWKKYSVMYKLDPGGFWDKIGINHRILRYADMYLLLAEVENEIGTSVKALEYLNKTRLRPSVAMPPYPTAAYPSVTKQQIFTSIMHERAVELAGEEIRNFDILRWRKAGKLTADPISYFSPNKYEYLPIPQTELDNNPNVGQEDQKPGY